MNILHAMEQEFEAIVNDINLHPEYVGDYDLVGCMKAIEGRKDLVTKNNTNCSLEELQKILCDNNEYKNLSKKNCYYFNIIKDNLPNEYLDSLFEYEDIHSQIEGVVLKVVKPLTVTNR
ncbi:MAG: hypothetical protein N4A63_09570 [Vallitalea sp.]|jgi:hypothetical protein|nr:hypothetical protein [Vallitalea sp.]